MKLTVKDEEENIIFIKKLKKFYEKEKVRIINDIENNPMNIDELFKMNDPNWKIVDYLKQLIQTTEICVSRLEE